TKLTGMSEKALRDLNTILGTERKNEGSSKACLTKPSIDNVDENIEEWKKKKNVVTANSDVEVVIAEVEYIEFENLNDLKDVDTYLKTLLAGLESKDWVLVCDALNNVRRLSIFHKEAMLDIAIRDVITSIAKSLKNSRSVVCKTTIMTFADIFNAYNDLIIDSLGPLNLIIHLIVLFIINTFYVKHIW
ncbi:hypothetical protein CR513_14302, partial [Mucuna pruriens]